MAYSRKNYQKRSTAPKSRFAKRWYIDASIPKSVPFIGGSSLRAGSGTLNKRSLNAIVKRELSNNLSLKKKVINITSLDNFKHNTLYTFNPLGNITIGTGENARLSTDIHVKKIQVSMRITNRTDLAPPFLCSATHIRMMWVRSENDVLASSDTFASGLGTSSLFVDGQNDPMLSTLDKDKLTVLSDTIYEIPASPIFYDTALATAKPTISSKVIHFDCPQKEFGFKYQTLTSGYSAVNKNVYLVLCPYIEGATTGDTAVVNYQFGGLTSGLLKSSATGGITPVNYTTLAEYGILDAQPLDSDLTTLATLSAIPASGFIKKTGTHTISIDTATYQPLDTDLTNIAALGFASTSFLKKTALNTWSLDTNAYIS